MRQIPRATQGIGARPAVATVGAVPVLSGVVRRPAIVTTPRRRPHTVAQPRMARSHPPVRRAASRPVARSATPRRHGRTTSQRSSCTTGLHRTVRTCSPPASTTGSSATSCDHRRWTRCATAPTARTERRQGSTPSSARRRRPSRRRTSHGDAVALSDVSAVIATQWSTSGASTSPGCTSTRRDGRVREHRARRRHHERRSIAGDDVESSTACPVIGRAASIDQCATAARPGGSVARSAALHAGWVDCRSASSSCAYAATAPGQPHRRPRALRLADGRAPSRSVSRRTRYLYWSQGLPRPEVAVPTSSTRRRDCVGITDLAWPGARSAVRVRRRVKYGRLLKPGSGRQATRVFAEKLREDAPASRAPAGRHRASAPWARPARATVDSTSPSRRARCESERLPPDGDQRADAADRLTARTPQPLQRRAVRRIHRVPSGISAGTARAEV